MRTQAMDLPGEVVAGGLIAAGLGVLGFLFRTAAGETLRGLRDSMASLQRSVDNLSSKLETVAVQQANHESRISVMEDRQQRD
jgi:hypothetical protein